MFVIGFYYIIETLSTVITMIFLSVVCLAMVKIDLFSFYRHNLGEYGCVCVCVCDAICAA